MPEQSTSTPLMNHRSRTDMQPRQNHRGAGQEIHRSLPRQLAEAVAPRARRALMHGMRRRILRLLHRVDTPRTLREIAQEFPNASLSQVSYHVLVLSDCGSVAIAGIQEDGGKLTQSFLSTVAASPQILGVLLATETLDDVH